MSVFFIDKTVSVKTVDGTYLLFTKGGDNNLICDIENKRHSKWLLLNVVKGELYHDYIEKLVLDTFAGGTLQFQSHFNKVWKGGLDKDFDLISKFEKLYKNPIEISWQIEKVNGRNINKFVDDIKNELLKNNIDLNGVGSSSSNSLGMIYNDDKKEASQRIKDFLNARYPKSQNYASFVKKYKGVIKEVLVNDVSFCSHFMKFRKSFGHGVDMLADIAQDNKVFDLGFANFNLIVSSHYGLDRQLKAYRVEQLVRRYASCFETISKLIPFQIRVQKLIDGETDEVDKKTMKNNFDLIFNTDYVALKEELKKFVDENTSINCKAFIETFNSIVDLIKDRDTSVLASKIDVLEKYASLNSFKLGEHKKELSTFSSEDIISCYENQEPKNKQIVKKFAVYIVDNLNSLIGKVTVDELCKYFNLKGFKKDIEVKDSTLIEKTTNEISPVANTAATNVDESISKENLGNGVKKVTKTSSKDSSNADVVYKQQSLF